METVSGSDINIEVRMMHPVETPEYRDEVKEHMLKVNDKIEGDDRDENLGPEWQMRRA